MRTAVGISGGVDSSVAALLLKEAGDEIVGITMTLGRAGEDEMVSSAKAAAERLGIDFVCVDFASEWKREVADYIKRIYLDGRTPNPCVKCNESVKFGLLPRYAFGKLGCDRFATGHYARTEGGRLFRGADHAKDQSYFLYRVEREVLTRTVFPLGGMMKDEVRATARSAGMPSAEDPDSQDFCGGEIDRFVNEPDREGDIVDIHGRKLGVHRGFWHYTIGKRKGLGIGGGTPYYVVRLDAVKNEVVVAFRDDAVKYDLKLVDTVGEIDMALPVKVRSAGEPKPLADGIIGIAPGQSAVFYRGEEIVGGGYIA